MDFGSLRFSNCYAILETVLLYFFGLITIYILKNLVKFHVHFLSKINFILYTRWYFARKMDVQNSQIYFSLNYPMQKKLDFTPTLFCPSFLVFRCPHYHRFITFSTIGQIVFLFQLMHLWNFPTFI